METVVQIRAKWDISLTNWIAKIKHLRDKKRINNIQYMNERKLNTKERGIIDAQ